MANQGKVLTITLLRQPYKVIQNKQLYSSGFLCMNYWYLSNALPFPSLDYWTQVIKPQILAP